MLSYKKITEENRVLFFLGDFLNPDLPQKNNEEVIKSLYYNNFSFDQIIENTYSIFGKWIIIEETKEEIKVFGDPFCTKSIKFFQSGLAISDLASLVAQIMQDESAHTLPEENNHHRFAKQDFQETCWWCGDATLFLNTFSLLPNHKLIFDKRTNQASVKRFLPTKKLEESFTANEYLEHCYSRSMKLLTGFVQSLTNRSPFALTVTGGKDCRILFSACHSAAIDAHYFVSVHGGKTFDAPDITTPKELLQKLNCPFFIYKTEPGQATVDLIRDFFPEIPAEKYASFNYASNFDQIPQHSKVVLGLIPEVISGYYHHRLFFLTGKGLADISRHAGNRFAIQKYDEWLEGLKEETLPYGYTILDLFYWEHRGGRWAAQTVNVCDLYEDLIFGFNCREFVDIWMKTNINERAWPDRRNLEILTGRFGKEYLSVPYAQKHTLFSRGIYLLEKSRFSVVLRQMDYLYKRKRKYFRKPLNKD